MIRGLLGTWTAATNCKSKCRESSFCQDDILNNASLFGVSKKELKWKKEERKEGTEVDGVEISFAYLSFNEIKKSIFLCFFMYFRIINAINSINHMHCLCILRAVDIGLCIQQKVLKIWKGINLRVNIIFIKVCDFLRNWEKMSASLKIDLYESHSVLVR